MQIRSAQKVVLRSRPARGVPPAGAVAIRCPLVSLEAAASYEVLERVSDVLQHALSY
jgi:hypothetical protein